MLVRSQLLHLLSTTKTKIHEESGIRSLKQSSEERTYENLHD